MSVTDSASSRGLADAESGAVEREAPPSERAAQILADLEKFRSMDPLGPDGWEAIRQHIKRHGLHIGSEE